MQSCQLYGRHLDDVIISLRRGWHIAKPNWHHVQEDTLLHNAAQFFHTCKGSKIFALRVDSGEKRDIWTLCFFWSCYIYLYTKSWFKHLPTYPQPSSLQKSWSQHCIHTPISVLIPRRPTIVCEAAAWHLCHRKTIIIKCEQNKISF